MYGASTVIYKQSYCRRINNFTHHAEIVFSLFTISFLKKIKDLNHVALDITKSGE